MVSSAYFRAACDASSICLIPGLAVAGRSALAAVSSAAASSAAASGSSKMLSLLCCLVVCSFGLMLVVAATKRASRAALNQGLSELLPCCQLATVTLQSEDWEVCMQPC